MMQVFFAVTLACVLAAECGAQTNLNDLRADLRVPPTETGTPTAGRRVRATTEDWAGTAVHHTLYLPEDWKPGVVLPVIVEYAGNGGYANALGDTSDGTVDGCMLGYGLSAGRGFIWIVLPFVERVNGHPRNATKWWGDVAETKRYCLVTVRDVCARYGGDQTRVVLMGFSRGAIACSYVGLHDEEIAALWCGFLAHSHFEGEFKHPAPDADAWAKRLHRLGSRPLFISQEISTQKTAGIFDATGVTGLITFADLPHPNHSARWVLCDVPLRERARAWLRETVRQRN
jgi:hypothetical protein